MAEVRAQQGMAAPASAGQVSAQQPSPRSQSPQQSAQVSLGPDSPGAAASPGASPAHASLDAPIEAQIAIIGFGPVGVTAANFLGKMGVRTVVIEQDADLYSRARAIATDEEVVRIWQGIGLADTLKADMLSDCPIDFVGSDGRSFLSYTPKPRGNGHPTQLFIYQPALEQTLRDAVPQHASVSVLLGHEAADMDQDDSGVTFSIRRVDDGATGSVRAQYVIAADGGSSPTRRRLGVGFEGRTYEDRWVVIDTKVLRKWPEVDRLRFHCNPERPAVDCPTPLDHYRWEFPVLPGDDEDELVTHHAIRDLLGHQGIDPDNVEILRAVIYSHHVRFADRWRIGRVFLAGDAAHVMPPWVGEGMASGVRDASNLAWKLAAVLNGSLPDAALDSYETERKPHVRKLTQAAVLCGRIITERRRLIAALRNPFMRAFARLPKIGGLTNDGDWFPAARYARGLLGTTPRARRCGRLAHPAAHRARCARQRRAAGRRSSRWLVSSGRGQRGAGRAQRTGPAPRPQCVAALRRAHCRAPAAGIDAAARHSR